MKTVLDVAGGGVCMVMSDQRWKLCAAILELLEKLESGHGELHCSIYIRDSEPARLVVRSEESLKLD